MIKIRKSPDFKGNKNPNFKDGKTMDKYYCKVCKKKISLKSALYGSSLCRSCVMKKRMENPKNNPNWKGGTKYFPHYCRLCNQKISYFSWKHGKGRCKPCFNKYIKESGILMGKNNPMYGMTGDKCIHWQGGKSFEPYSKEFTNNLKERIRFRDGYKCQECGVPQKECIGRLHIHHIDYDKKNSNEDNLISLCRSCHTKTNFGRKEWTEHYKNSISILVVC